MQISIRIEEITNALKEGGRNALADMVVDRARNTLMEVLDRAAGVSVSRIEIPSQTRHDMQYRVTLVNDKAVACTCPHFHFREGDANGECKHFAMAETLNRQLAL